MTVASTTSRVSFTGNGSSTNFSFPYYFLADGDLVVIKKLIADGTETILALNTDYTVSGAGVLTGGSITTIGAGSPLSSAYKLTIYRDPALTQNMDLVENDNLPAETVEKAFDRLTMIDQRSQNWINRTVKLSEGTPDGVFDPTLPSDLDLAPNSVPVLNASATGWAPTSDWPSTTDLNDAEANAAAAAASAVASAASAVTSAGSATAAATSASNAAATLASAFFRDVVYITSADSPVTVAQAHNGKVFNINSSGGTITFNLPSIAGITTPFNIAFVLETAGNNVTIARNGADLIAGATSKILSAAGTGCQLAADVDATPDGWSTLDFGSVADSSITPSKLSSSATNTILNSGLAASVGSSALTVALKDATGSDPSASSPVKIPFRSATATTGTPVLRSVAGALSVVVSSGSTLGSTDADPNWVYVYAIDNAGTVELAVSGSRFIDEGSLVTTTAEGGAGAADDKNTLYSTTARSNVAVRLLGRVKSTQATAGTWATSPSEISLLPFENKTPRSQVRLHTFNGRGAVNTSIQRFSTAVDNYGPAITYADSANNGASFTINEDGLYSIVVGNAGNEANDSAIAGISLNSTQLGTDIGSITAADRLAYHAQAMAVTVFGTFTNAQAAWTGYLHAKDVVRPHVAGSTYDPDVASYSFMTICKVCD